MTLTNLHLQLLYLVWQLQYFNHYLITWILFLTSWGVVLCSVNPFISILRCTKQIPHVQSFLSDPTYLLLLGCEFIKDEVHSNHLGKNCAIT